MATDGELAALARQLIDANHYLTLGTADETGRPWTTPVYFTAHGYHEFYWVSSPDAAHSRNIARRPEISAVIFDSHARIGAAEAVYLVARAEAVPDAELERAAELFRQGPPQLAEFTPDLLTAPAPFRLYRARVDEHSVLIRGGDPAYDNEVDARRTVHP